MDARVKEVQKRIVDFWNKYDKKQKTLIISVSVTIVLALVILAFVLTRTTYEELITAEDTISAADVTDALNANAIPYETSNNGLTILVPSNQVVTASYLIAQEGLTATGYTFDSYIENMGFSTTSEDRERLYQKYLEDKIKATLESFDYVRSAYVQMTVPSTKLSVLNDKEETSVAVKLTLSKNADATAYSSLAKYLATAVGNETTGNITIIDSSGNTLFEGQETSDGKGALSTVQQNQIYDRFYDEMVNKVSKALATTQMYNTITVSPNINVDFSTTDSVDTHYYNDDDVLFSDYNYEATGGSSSGGIPGTDSNDDDTTYYIQTGDDTNNSVTLSKNEYAVSSKVTHIQGQQGVINYDKSSMGVVVNKYIIYNEDTLDAAGELKDVSWEEYIASHSDIVPLEVPDGIIQMISDITGIPEVDISFSAYQVPLFEASEGNGDVISNVLPIILALVILALLGFIVWRSLKPVSVNELEPELSVEELLTATKENQISVEDIGLEEKSETRKAIEKFVDENPEAVALLLRNWLNDDWD
ncbi:MAG: flagellar M-ring protein FliF [Clostridiales bacterium]|nr:flagellar M-ring protein FliF [Clostridiales bacterium]